MIDTQTGSAAATVTIGNRRGLHARAAAKFVKVAELYEADVQVTKGDTSVAATSIMGLMMLAAATGHDITVSATGPQAREAVAALVSLVEQKFDED